MRNFRSSFYGFYKVFISIVEGIIGRRIPAVGALALIVAILFPHRKKFSGIKLHADRLRQPAKIPKGICRILSFQQFLP